MAVRGGLGEHFHNNEFKGRPGELFGCFAALKISLFHIQWSESFGNGSWVYVMGLCVMAMVNEFYNKVCWFSQ